MLTRSSRALFSAFCSLAVLLQTTIATAQEAGAPRFADTEKWAKAFDSADRDEWQKPAEVILALDLPANAVVVDIGAGTGYFTARLSLALPRGRVIAADTEPEMVRYLRARVEREDLRNVTVVQATRESPKLPEPVDCVLVVNVQSLVMSPGNYFRDLRPMLKHGGKVAIISTRMDAAQGARKESRRPPEHVKREMARQGFVLASEHDFILHQYVLIFRPE